MYRYILLICFSAFVFSSPANAEYTIYEKPAYKKPTLEELDKTIRQYDMGTFDYNIKSETIKQDFPPSSVDQIVSKNGHMCRMVKLIIDKSDRKLSIYYGDQLQKTYKARLGFTPKGRKEKRDDGKTPEGTYTVAYKNGKSQYYKAFAVSYPNSEDSERARNKGFNTGGDIMIHGLPNNANVSQRWNHWLGKDWTAGCIALDNEDIDELWRVVDQGALIIINP